MGDYGGLMQGRGAIHCRSRSSRLFLSRWMVVLRWAVLSIFLILDRRPRLCSDFLTVESIK